MRENTVSHGEGGARRGACRAWSARAALERGGFERYTDQMYRSRRLPGRASVVRAGSRPIRSSDVRARREKAASVAERHRFPRTHPNLATGATAAARARTVLRAAETLAPARKRHWTAEIADIVAGGCECGYEAGRLSRFRLGARARRITLRQNECHESRSRQRLSQSSSSISSERTRPVEFENSSQDSSEGSIGDSIGKSARRRYRPRLLFFLVSTRRASETHA